MGDQQTQAAQGRKRKHFVPLENNPSVMSSLLHTLGLSPSLGFHDVYSLDDPDLLAFVPRPAHALLLVLPVTATYEQFRHDEDKDKPEYTGSGDEEEVLWYKQTIGNACGLIALLHAASNGSARPQISEGSDLHTLIKDAIPLAPTERAELVEESDALERAHSTAAATGDTAAPNAADEVDLHFVCFVKSGKSGNLYEMDGRRKGPIDRGVLGEGDDVLSEKALELGPKAFLRRGVEGGDVRFSLIALAESFDD